MMSEDDLSSSRSHDGIPHSYRPHTQVGPDYSLRDPNNKKPRYYCKICQLENNLREQYNLKECGRKTERHQRGMMYCKGCKCHAHECYHPPTSRLIFELPEFFIGLSCFGIMHKLSEEEPFLNIADGKRTTVNKSHTIFQRLKDVYQEKHGDPVYTKKELKQIRKKKRS